jgi:ABC-type microcin C transport system duplicated ATPase subunit YejF
MDCATRWTPMTAEPLLELKNIRVTFDTQGGAVEAVKNVSLTVARGETLAIVGESGSGKSQLMMAVMGLLAKTGRAEGEALLETRNIIGLSKQELNRIRGEKITMIFQEPMTSLDPLYRIGSQLMEPIIHHQKLSTDAARLRAIELLKLVKLPDPELRMRSYPFELSGGQRQRVMIAMALANDPELLIADEPTTALDVTIQAEILELLKDLQRKLGMAMIFITHDLNVVRRIANRVCVMRHGEVVEQGATKDILTKPKQAYTRALVKAEPTGRKQPISNSAHSVLTASDLHVRFMLPSSLLGEPKELKAVDGISLNLREGETIGIVGESGSGKSTLARALLRLLPSRGDIQFNGRSVSALDKSAMQPLRKQMQLVFQDPFGSLSPRMTAGQIIAEGLLVHERSMSRVDRDNAVSSVMEEVGLDAAMRNRYPHEFSGGQRQRLAIARAIILKPKLVVLDEPTSALDRQVQKQIVELLRNLQAKEKLSYLFISHDLAVVRAMSDHIMVMRNGKLVEEGAAEQVINAPREDYTRKLMAAAFPGQQLPEKALSAI